MNTITLDAFQKQIGSESDCSDRLYQARWPNGFQCPVCDHRQASVISTRRLPLYECRRCHRQTSLIAGTVMEKSHTPIIKWLFTMWLMSQTEQGVNAVQLQSLLDVSYKTAFYMLRKLRFALGTPEGRPPLDNCVQAGLDFIGRLIGSSGSWVEERKLPIISAVSVDTHGTQQQVTIASVPAEFIHRNVLLPSGQQHFIALHAVAEASSIDIAPSLLLTNRQYPKLRAYGKSVRQWVNDMFHGLGATYLQLYLDEFAFRINVRPQAASAFERMMYLAMNTCYPSDLQSHSNHLLLAA